jgi:type IV secretory pathway protease TraF
MFRPRLALALPGWRIAVPTFVAASAAILLAGLVGSLFIWNLSSSLPRGLYKVAADGRAARGAIVAFEPPSPAAALVVERGYLPRGALLLKTVVALPGDLYASATLSRRMGASSERS